MRFVSGYRVLFVGIPFVDGLHHRKLALGAPLVRSASSHSNIGPPLDSTVESLSKSRQRDGVEDR